MPYDDLQRIPICRESGNNPSPACENIDTIYSNITQHPTPLCNYHQIIHTNKNGTLRVGSDCESPSQMLHQKWFVLPPAMEWYYKASNPNYKSLPPWKVGCEGNSLNNAMEMIYPKRSASIFIPIELDGTKGKCVFEVAHRNRNSKIFWHLDEVYIGSTREFHQMSLAPTPGKHLLVLVDEKGERLEQAFEIIK